MNETQYIILVRYLLFEKYTLPRVMATILYFVHVTRTLIDDGRIN